LSAYVVFPLVGRVAVSQLRYTSTVSNEARELQMPISKKLDKIRALSVEM